MLSEVQSGHQLQRSLACTKVHLDGGMDRTLEGHHPVSEEVVRAHEAAIRKEGSLTEAMPVFKCEEL